MSKCAFLGLGVMGYPMAGHLTAAGHEVTVWNRTGAKAQSWAQDYGGHATDEIESAVKDAEFVCVCVGDDPDVYAVVRPAIAALGAGAIIVDHTTASAECARALHGEAQAEGIGFIDAPISGGEAGAVKGQLTVMCGGEADIFSKAEPVIDAYAKAITLMGPSGAGQLTKMVNQICISGILQGLAEGVNFAQKAGLDVDKVVGAIGKGAAQSWQMDNRASTMGRGEYEFGFALDWMRKDLRIALETGEAVDADLTLAKQVDGYYKEVQAMGGGRWDTSALLARLQK